MCNHFNIYSCNTKINDVFSLTYVMSYHATRITDSNLITKYLRLPIGLLSLLNVVGDLVTSAPINFFHAFSFAQYKRFHLVNIGSGHFLHRKCNFLSHLAAYFSKGKIA